MNAEHQIVEELEFDLREYSESRGFLMGLVGHCGMDDGALIYTCSLADPREGTNSERLQIEPFGKRGARLSGYFENGKSFDLVDKDVSMQDAMDRLLAAWNREQDLVHVADMVDVILSGSDAGGAV